MTEYFKPIAYSEGISFLLLLSVAMPMKYVFGIACKAYDGGRQHGISSMTNRVADASGVKPLKAAEVEFHRFIGWRCLGIAGR